MYNTFYLLLALTLVPISLSAQPKPVARKPVSPTHRTTAAHPTSTRTPVSPVKKSAPVTKPTTSQPASASVASTTQVAPAAPAPAAEPVQQTATTSRPVAPPAPVHGRQSRFRVGFRVGGNSSTMGGVDGSELGEGVRVNRVTGFHGGVVFNIGGPKFSVQPEILFTQYGVRMAFGPDYLQIKYNVVEVPVLLKATFGESNLRFFVTAGPVATYAMSGTVSVRQGGQSESQTVDMRQQGQFSYGASGGAGITLNAGPGTILLEGRYSYLLSGSAGTTQTTPQNAMLSVGYLMPLGGR